MNLLNRLFPGIFLFLLFLATCWPNKSLGAIELGSAVFYVSELAMLFMPCVYVFCPTQSGMRLSPRLRKSIIIFFVAIFLVGLAKVAFMGERPLAFIRDLRHILPLLSGLALLYMGMRIRPKLVWTVLLIALSCSYVSSFLFFVLDIDPIFISTKEGELEVAGSVRGRMVNVNSALSVIALGVLVVWKSDGVSQKVSMSVLVVCLMCLGTSILTFNRTLMFAYPVALFVFLFFHFDFRKAASLIIAIIFTAGAATYFYSSNDTVRRQVDKRILSIQYGLGAVLESGYYGTRDVMYEEYKGMIKDYWFLGTPYHVPKSFKKTKEGILAPVFVTDISLMTIMLKFGIVGLFSFVWLLWAIFREGLDIRRYLLAFHPSARVMVNAFLFSLVVYLPISLNSDVLTRQAPIFYLCIILMFSSALGERHQRSVIR